MFFPLWALFGLVSAAFSAGMMLVQERVKVDGYAIAFWSKVACIVLMLPLALYFGLPDDPLFYALVLSQAILWAISDVIFFNAIARVGAGVISRILPLSVIATFCLWFVFDPALLGIYLETPVRSALVFITLCASVWFTMQLKACPISWQALRIIWFVLFAAVIGPLLFKLVAQHTDIQRGPFSYVVVEAAAMVALWLLYHLIRRPVPRAMMLDPSAIKAGFAVGFFMSLMVASNFAAMFYVDNPGLVPAVKFTDTLLIMLFYKATGRKETANVAAGLGIVACAVIIILLRSYGV
jgi:hypothetical protein